MMRIHLGRRAFGRMCHNTHNVRNFKRHLIAAINIAIRGNETRGAYARSCNMRQRDQEKSNAKFGERKKHERRS